MDREGIMTRLMRITIRERTRKMAALGWRELVGALILDPGTKKIVGFRQTFGMTGEDGRIIYHQRENDRIILLDGRLSGGPRESSEPREYKE